MNGHSDPTSDSVRVVVEDSLAGAARARRAAKPAAASDKASCFSANGQHRPVASQRTKSRRLGAATDASRRAVFAQRVRRWADRRPFLGWFIFVRQMKQAPCVLWRRN